MADKKDKTAETNTDIVLFQEIDKEEVKRRLFHVRGLIVILDADIAEYFGVETGALNRAMKRNIKRFPPNFCIQLTREECSRCQIGILNSGRGSNIKYLPYAYTEQGVAMLTSCLHTERAITSSIQIMEAFVEITHILRHNRLLASSAEIARLEDKTNLLDTRVENIEKKMVTKDDISDLIKLFDTGAYAEEILILDGQPFKADLAYQKIIKQAKKNILLVDDYVGIKTLQHLTKAKKGVEITIVSDNKMKTLRLAEYDDFTSEYPNVKITLLKSSNRVHDRYIILDHGTKDMKVYHSGASVKDAGRKITTITRITDIAEYKDVAKGLVNNPPLVLR